MWEKDKMRRIGMEDSCFVVFHLLRTYTSCVQLLFELGWLRVGLMS